MTCLTCIGLDCHNTDDLTNYSLQSGVFFTSPRYSFVLNCPPGYSCAPGYYPRTIIIDPGDSTVTIPEDYFNDDGVLTTAFTQSLTCCDTAIAINCPVGSTLTEVASIINSAFEQCAAAKAACLNLTAPGQGVQPPRPVNKNILITINSKGGCLGESFAATLKATGGTALMTWSVASGTLPSGLIFESESGGDPILSRTAGIIGTPTVAGNYTFTILIQDATGAINTKTFTLGILDFTNVEPGDGTVGGLYTFTFTATGGLGPYTFATIDTSDLPPGLTLSEAGVLSGTPTEAGDFEFDVIVRDANGATCQEGFDLTVSASTFVLSSYWTFDRAGDPIIIPGPSFYGGPDYFAFRDQVADAQLVSIWSPTLDGPFGQLAPGKIGNGLSSPGGALCVLRATTPAYDSTTQDGFSLFGWLRFNVIANDFGPFSLELPVGGNPAPGFQWLAGPGEFNLAGGASAVAPVSLGVWFFVAYTYNYSTGEEILYFNGASLVSDFVGPFPGAGANTILTWVFGQAANSTQTDEIGMSVESILTPAQVLSLYNGGAGKTWPAVQSP